MKPIFIYENENCEKITISREKFEKLINEAYENGCHDASPVIRYVPYDNYPNAIPSITYGRYYTTEPLEPTITCENPQVSYTTAKTSK